MGEQTPHRDIERFCDCIGITNEHFFEVADRFRSAEVWVKQNGAWMMDDFIVPDWKWK